MNENPLLKLSAVSHRYLADDAWVLHNINLEIRHGFSTSIVGVSGRGKTTLLRILAGLVRPTEGTVAFDGHPLDHPCRSIAVVFQNYQPTVFDWLTVDDNIRLGVAPVRRGTMELSTQIERVATDLGIIEILKRPAKKLSGGQKQRVAIARALVQGASALVLDEPFSNLDPVSKHELIDALMRTKRDYGTTLILVSHDVREALVVADVAYCLLRPSTVPQLQLVQRSDLRDLRRVHSLEERFGHVYSTLLLDRSEEL